MNRRPMPSRPRLSLFLQSVALMVNVLLAQVRPSRLDERVKLGKECHSPHQEATRDGEDKGRTPEPKFETTLAQASGQVAGY